MKLQALGAALYALLLLVSQAAAQEGGAAAARPVESGPPPSSPAPEPSQLAALALSPAPEAEAAAAGSEWSIQLLPGGPHPPAAEPASRAGGGAAGLAAPAGAAAPSPGQLSAQPLVPATCWLQEATDLLGADLVPAGNTTRDAGECCSLCWDTAGCGAWTFRPADRKCWVKAPTGWQRVPGHANLTSGLVTASTFQAYNFTRPPPPAPAPAAARPSNISMLLTRLQAPLFGQATWRLPPPGYPSADGKCFLLPQRNVNGTVLQTLLDTTLDACCEACSQEPRCTAFNYCPDLEGCNNGFGNIIPAFSCDLKHQNVSAFNLTEESLSFWYRGHADVADFPPGYTVPFLTGLPLRSPPPCNGGVPCSYTLHPGELVSNVSSQFDFPLDSLILLNPWLTNVSWTYPGQSVSLPCCLPPPPEVGLPAGQRSSSLGAGAIAAIAAVGGVALLALSAGGVLLWRRRRRRPIPPEEVDMASFRQKLGDTLSELDAALSNNGKPSPTASGETIVQPAGGSGTMPDTPVSPAGRQPTMSSESSIPDLGFGTGLLSPADYRIDTDPVTGQPALLGKGHFGEVYRGSCGLEPAAIKVIKDGGGGGGAVSDLDRQQLLREVAILKSCRSQYLVSFLGVCMNEQQFVIVTELLLGGNLFRALKAGKVDWYRRGHRIAIDVARGLDYLHRRSIIHLDLKSPNVLLTEHGRAKVADVGLARMVPATHSYFSGNVDIGTFPWCAPEQLLGHRCSTRSDIYSYGVLLWEICTSLTPVRGHMREVRVPEEAPQAVADLIHLCTSSQPEQRPSAETIVTLLTALPMPKPQAGRDAPGQQQQGGVPRHESGATGGGSSSGAAAAQASSSPR